VLLIFFYFYIRNKSASPPFNIQSAHSPKIMGNPTRSDSNAEMWNYELFRVNFFFFFIITHGVYYSPQLCARAKIWSLSIRLFVFFGMSLYRPSIAHSADTMNRFRPFQWYTALYMSDQTGVHRWFDVVYWFNIAIHRKVNITQANKLTPKLMWSVVEWFDILSLK